jgi:hypothetical protein
MIEKNRPKPLLFQIRLQSTGDRTLYEITETDRAVTLDPYGMTGVVHDFLENPDRYSYDRHQTAGKIYDAILKIPAAGALPSGLYYLTGLLLETTRDKRHLVPRYLIEEYYHYLFLTGYQPHQIQSFKPNYHRDFRVPCLVSASLAELAVEIMPVNTPLARACALYSVFLNPWCFESWYAVSFCLDYLKTDERLQFLKAAVQIRPHPAVFKLAASISGSRHQDLTAGEKILSRIDASDPRELKFSLRVDLEKVIGVIFDTLPPSLEKTLRFQHSQTVLQLTQTGNADFLIPPDEPLPGYAGESDDSPPLVDTKGELKPEYRPEPGKPARRSCFGIIIAIILIFTLVRIIISVLRYFL